MHQGSDLFQRCLCTSLHEAADGTVHQECAVMHTCQASLSRSARLQVISDFGFGPWRKAADDFLATFEPSYALKEKRIGSPGAARLCVWSWSIADEHANRLGALAAALDGHAPRDWAQPGVGKCAAPSLAAPCCRSLAIFSYQPPVTAAFHAPCSRRHRGCCLFPAIFPTLCSFPNLLLPHILLPQAPWMPPRALGL